MINSAESNQKSLFRFIYSFYKKHFAYLFLIIFIAFLLGTYNVIDGYLKRSLIDSLSDSSEKIKANYYGIFKNTSLILLFYILNHAYWRSLNVIQIKIGHKIKNNITRECFAQIHSQSLKFFQNNLSGSLSHNIIILGENIQLLIHKYLVTFVRAFFQMILVLGAMYFVNPVFSMIIGIWIVFFISFSIFFFKRFRSASKDYAKVSAETSGKIVDSISNFFNVKIFASIFFEQSKLNKSLDEMEQKFKKKEIILLAINITQAFSIALSFGFTLFFLVKFKINGQISIGEFVFTLSLFFHISENIWWVSEYIGIVNEIFGKCHAALEKIFSPIEMIDSENSKNIKIQNAKIEFKNINFGYIGCNDSLLFKNLSITIESGKKIGLVGNSGVGKSSLVNLLLRLYELNSGEILIDGHDVRDFKQNSLRSQISVIPQDPFLFHRTIFENLEYGLMPEEQELSKDEKKEKIVQAAKLAKAHDFIESFPGKYNSFVGERGVKLSGGQKQRIAIARAILRGAPILVLDEATSALDSVTENEIQKSLEILMKNKTVIAIAHRLSTLLKMDRILVFENGEIIEDGKHDELLKKNGVYKKLWDMQKDGFLPEN